LARRSVAGAVLAAVGFTIVWYGGSVFYAWVALGASALSYEWVRLTAGGGASHRRDLIALVLGLLMVLLAAAATIWLREDFAEGRATLIWLLFVVWATDIGAYAWGRLIGGPKLAPWISPSKTWAGAVGGLLVGLGFSVLIGFALDEMGWASERPLLSRSLGFGALISLATQGGDLLESWFKRRHGVKDSGAWIPGHGGVLDRMDGYLLAVLCAGLVVFLADGEQVFWASS
jgi:phosphatidate cytidylyltransferase